MTRALLLALALAAPAAALEVPFLAGRVNDNAGLLSSSARDSLETKLKEYEARTGHQVVVLTVDSLGLKPFCTCNGSQGLRSSFSAKVRLL